MMAQVVLDKAGDEEIAVIIAWLHAQLEVLTRGFAGLDKEVWPELFFEKSIGRSLVDQQ
jgi:hypothetical protein